LRTGFFIIFIVVLDLKTNGCYASLLWFKGDLLVQEGLRFAISGAAGLVGQALTNVLQAQGHTVVAISRSIQTAPNAVLWKDMQPGKALPTLEGLDGVVHLAGETIAQWWSPASKQRILESRVQSTRQLSEVLASLERPPKVLVSASAIGYYGNQGTTLLTEQAPLGNQFLSQVCQQWEAATQFAEHAGIRCVHTRFGIILSPKSGALKTMLPAFKLGVAGPLGSGKQVMSWVSLEDVVGALLHCLSTPSLTGAVNVVAPNPETNAEFTKALSNVVMMPAVIPAPEFALKALLRNGLAEELLLSSANVVPQKLLASGYPFKHPHLEEALWALLKKDSVALKMLKAIWVS
jgi:uncharacterized protein